MNKERYIAFKCLGCGVINVFRCSKPDGHNCVECRGVLTPIGNAVIDDKKNKSCININVNVDTTQLDSTLDKAKELQSILRRIGLGL